MRKTFAAVATAVLLFGLTACSNGDGPKADVEGCMTSGEYKAGCTTVIQYEGRDLHCVTWEGHGGTGMTCDFVRFYNENVEPFVEPTPTGPAYETE